MFDANSLRRAGIFSLPNKLIGLSTLMGLSLLGCQVLEGETENAVSEQVLRGRWQVTSLAGSPVEPRSRAYLEFSNPPRLTGSGGCNHFFGVYHYDNQTLEIASAIGSTRMACAAKTMAQEQYMFHLLPDAVRAELGEADGDEAEMEQKAELLLRDETGRVLITAVRELEAQR